VIPFPKQQKHLPTVLCQEEVSRLIDATGNLMHRAMVMTLYTTGVRRAELCRLKVADIDTAGGWCFTSSKARVDATGMSP
jgi:integrase/recombinase XerD